MTRRTPVLASFVFAFLVLLAATPTATLAAWMQDGNAISTASNNQSVPRAVSDGAGGAIIVWEDSRTGTYAIYAQRIDGYGVPQWTAGGVAVTTPNGDRVPQLVTDGAGGAIITWTRNNLDVYAQRISPTGTLLWGAGGVVVCNAVYDQFAPMIASDAAGGAYIVWLDFRNLIVTDYDVYMQRLNSAGSPQWVANGIQVCVIPYVQTEAVIAPDGAGGAVVAWTDYRSGLPTGDIYAQRVNSVGSTLWQSAGRALVTGGWARDPYIVSDGNGGAIVAWEDNRTTWEIYARRVDSAGNAIWSANGVQITNVTGTQWNPAVLADGVGGAFITWDDGRSGSAQDIYVQRVNFLGTAQWGANGVALASAGTDPEITADGVGGALVAWRDTRGVANDVYARRINGSGVPQWTSNGVALCTAFNVQDSPAIVPDGAGGAIVAWEDERANVGVNDIYAQRIDRNGYWGFPAPNIAKVRDVPGDQGGQINVSWDASRLDPWPDELIDTYTVWRSLSPAAAAAAIAGGAEVWSNGPVPAGKHGAIRVQPASQAGQATYYWQLIHTINAYGISAYSDIVPTPFDSTATSTGAISFQVIAHAAVGQWASPPASGRSVDNLAPLAPIQLTAQRAGADVHLLWNQNHEADLDHYAVYRKTSSGVTPIPANFLADAQDTVLVDANAPAGNLFYIVTALDVHENQSAQSNEASVSGPTPVEDTPRSYTLSVSSYPNPFNPRTTVGYTVPSRGRVTVAVYDARGAHVATLFDGERPAGAYSVDWDGRSAGGAAVGSGVYFARIEHNGDARTKKLVLLK